MPDALKLETSRLNIRSLTMDDLDKIHQILNACFGESPLEERREWLEWTVRNYIALARLHQPLYGERAVVLKATGELIGAVGLAPALGPYQRLHSFRKNGEQEDSFNQPEFGLFWAIAPEHQRKGYAAEAAQAMIDYAFNDMGIRRIVATTEFENEASQAVMHKLGMKVEQNPTPGEPFWFQVVGVLYNPRLKG
ncbi:MAG: GNAT family N-acetyltransferase [Anaerolineaceae bacterium]|nr:GNAT family N-acetyltransferase [Anaerolineaceae bacterium]